MLCHMKTRSKSLTRHPNSLANLKRGNLVNVVSLADLPKCTGTRADGKPCQRVATKANGRCLMHGGKRSKESPEKKAERTARNALTKAAAAEIVAMRKEFGPPPKEVTSLPACQFGEGENRSIVWPRRAAIIRAWHAQHTDGGAQWRQTLKTLKR